MFYRTLLELRDGNITLYTYFSFVLEKFLCNYACFIVVLFSATEQVENIEIHAHRAVLASASSYLFELFNTSEDLKRIENVITYKLNGGFDKDALEILVEYAYTGKLNIFNSQVSVFNGILLLADN